MFIEYAVFWIEKFFNWEIKGTVSSKLTFAHVNYLIIVLKSITNSKKNKFKYIDFKIIITFTFVL